MKAIIDRRNYNPLYWHLKPLLKDKSIRYIYIEGGSSASKTYTICQVLTELLLECAWSTYVVRKQNVDIKDTIYKSFKLAAKKLKLLPFLQTIEGCIRKADKTAEIRFDGLDGEENVKGLEDIMFVYMNEFSQFMELENDQMRKRLRGKENQKFIYDWNPISSELWIYKNLIDIDIWTDLPLKVQDCPSIFSGLDPEYSFKRINAAGDSIWIKTTYRDNWWIMGRPDGKAGFKDTHTLAAYEFDRIHKPNYYRIYANGDRGVIRTGGEFWKHFNEIKHVAAFGYEPGFPIHVSLDNNVIPYVTQSLWQTDGKTIRQIMELPCESPYNNAVKAAIKLAAYLRSISYADIVYIYGDPSAHSRTTIDVNNSSFFDKFIETLRSCGFLVVSRVERSAPRVAMSASFINDIYEFEYQGFSIQISDKCKTSINDYVSVQEDSRPGNVGGMVKFKVTDKVTKKTYEPIGHFSDAKRYFICKLLKNEFDKYCAKGNGRNATVGGR